MTPPVQGPWATRPPALRPLLTHVARAALPDAVVLQVLRVLRQLRAAVQPASNPPWCVAPGAQPVTVKLNGARP